MGLKTTYDLDLPDCEETLAFRALEQVLKNDGLFSRTVNKFSAWRGEDLDAMELSYSMCPYVAIGPAAQESDWLTEGQHSMPLYVRFLVAVRGTKYDNLANFWGMIRRAIYPFDNAEAEAVRAVMRGVGANLTTVATMVLNANTPIAGTPEQPFIIGQGTLRLGLHIRT